MTDSEATLSAIARHVSHVNISGVAEGEKPIASLTLRIPLEPANPLLEEFLGRVLGTKR